MTESCSSQPQLLFSELCGLSCERDASWTLKEGGKTAGEGWNEREGRKGEEIISQLIMNADCLGQILQPQMLHTKDANFAK